MARTHLLLLLLPLAALLGAEAQLLGDKAAPVGNDDTQALGALLAAGMLDDPELQAVVSTLGASDATVLPALGAKGLLDDAEHAAARTMAQASSPQAVEDRVALATLHDIGLLDVVEHAAAAAVVGAIGAEELGALSTLKGLGLLADNEYAAAMAQARKFIGQPIVDTAQLTALQKLKEGGLLSDTEYEAALTSAASIDAPTAAAVETEDAGAWCRIIGWALTALPVAVYIAWKAWSITPAQRFVWALGLLPMLVFALFASSSPSVAWLVDSDVVRALGLRAWARRIRQRPVDVALHESGQWSFRMLLTSLSVTPLRKFIGRGTLWLHPLRQTTGLLAFVYAAVHGGTYVTVELDMATGFVASYAASQADGHGAAWSLGAALRSAGKQSWLRFMGEVRGEGDAGGKGYLLFGAGAFIIMLALTITSDASLKRGMGTKLWRALHRLVYLSAILTGIHVWQYAGRLRHANVVGSTMYPVAVALLLGIRLVWWMRK